VLRNLLPNTLLSCSRSVGVVCLALAASVSAQTTQATHLTVEHRNGQTFLVWQEATALPAPEAYRVYTAKSRIQTVGDLTKATLVGEVAAGSWFNPRAKRAYVLKDNGPALTQAEGFFVVTPAGAGTSYYAVTAVKAKLENTKIDTSANGNSSTGIVESTQAPAPVLQAKVNGGTELYYVHFAPDVDVGSRKALFNRPGYAFDFKISYNPTSTGPRPVVVVMHARKGIFDIPRIPWLGSAFVQVSVDDVNPPGIHSMWFGFHEDYGKGPPKGKVIDYTERRVLWTLDQVLADKSLACDDKRVYAFGASLGAVGALGLGVRHGDRFAAVGGVDPAFGITQKDFSLKSETDALFGTPAQNLVTSLGPKIYDVFDYTSEMQRRAKDGVAPLLFTMGRGDNVTGWSEKPAFFRAAQRAGQPGAFYWDFRGHAQTGPWSAYEPKLFAEQFRIRLDKPLVAFSNLTLDDDPGDGNPLKGDTTGTMGGYAFFDPTTASSTAAGFTVDVGLKNDNSRLDYAIKSEARGNLTFRRLGAFKPVPRDLYTVVVKNKGKTEVESTRIATANGDGVISVPYLELSHTVRTIDVKPRPTTLPDLAFGGNARIGGVLVMSVMGAKGMPAMLTIGSIEVNFPTPFGTWRIGNPLFLWGGFFGENPLQDVYLPIPNVPAFRGAALLGQAMVGSKVTPLAKIKLR